ncbi:MAG: hypothetical protein CL582_17765 [Alteromonadaceae bacterium]|nr:hypothetical protein [Alteromonadaceae bacterium]
MEYGDPEHSVTYKVFHYYFRVRVPASFAHEKQARMLGTPVYEQKGMDETAANEMVTREHTIAEMVDLAARGASIEIIDPKMSVPIYALLKEHLDIMRGKLNNRLHSQTVPITDIRNMDSFLEILYPITRQYEQQDLTKSKSRQHADRLFSYRSIRKKKKTDENEENTTQVEGKKLREHRPITQDIAEIVAERNLRHK